MFKEIFICIIIVVSIISLDVFTQKYTQNTTSEITDSLSNLKGELLKEDKNEIEKMVKILDDKWNKKHDKLAYYIEHDELEKVDTAVVLIKSYIETEDYSSAIAELQQGKFVIEHIKKKNDFNLENIF